jgi:hypothetical protein
MWVTWGVFVMWDGLGECCCLWGVFAAASGASMPCHAIGNMSATQAACHVGCVGWLSILLGMDLNQLMQQGQGVAVASNAG